jgi:hypothetical protein
MKWLKDRWDEIAFLILALEAIAWLLSEIFLVRLVGYPVVIITMVLFFVHTLAVFEDRSAGSVTASPTQEPTEQQKRALEA